MNPAALKTQYKYCKPQSVIIIDTDSFTKRDLEKAQFVLENPFSELGIKNEVVEAAITSMCKESLKDSGLDNKTIMRTKNMFALGLVCWLFHRDIQVGEKLLREKFAKKPEIAEANIKVLYDGYHFGENTHASVSTSYMVPNKNQKQKGRYMDINGNKATAYGLIAAAEKAGLELYLGSYPITPATDILHELAKHKSLGVKTVQCEDEIAGCASAVGASFAGALAVTTTSGPGICLKSEAINLAVITELPLVIVDVQRGGPSTGLPTKSEQTDLLQVLYGRNGESDAGYCGCFTDRLFRCGIYGLQDCPGAHDSGSAADRCLYRKRFCGMASSGLEGISGYLSSLRDTGYGTDMDSVPAQSGESGALLGGAGYRRLHAPHRRFGKERRDRCHLYRT